MEPQVNKILSRLGKAEKTELKSEKVELSLIGDAKKLLSKIKGDLKKIESKGEKALDLNDEIQKLGNEALAQLNKLRKYQEDISSMSKDLGLTPPKELTELTKAIEDILTFRKRYTF